MPDGFDPRLLIDGILIVVVIEFAGVWFWLRKQRNSARLVAPFAWFLASGALLMLAVRTALAPTAQTGLLMGLLALAGLAHLACLATAWHAIRKGDEAAK